MAFYTIIRFSRSISFNNTAIFYILAIKMSVKRTTFKGIKKTRFLTSRKTRWVHSFSRKSYSWIIFCSFLKIPITPLYISSCSTFWRPEILGLVGWELRKREREQPPSWRILMIVRHISQNLAWPMLCSFFPLEKTFFKTL